MKLDDLIMELGRLRVAHGNVPVVSQDFMSGILHAVIVLPPPRVGHLAEMTKRERKLRLHDDGDGRERGQKVIVV